MDATEEALKIIQGLPDDCYADDILAELFFKKQIDAGAHGHRRGSGRVPR